MQRNVLAARLGRSRSLPPVLGDPQACSRCFQVSNCSLLHKVALVVSHAYMPCCCGGAPARLSKKSAFSAA